MALQQTMVSRFRVTVVLLAIVLVTASSVLPGMATAESSGTLLCCLDEWQGGGGCPSGQRVASYCGSGCQSCGSMFCYTQPSGPGKYCLE